MGRPQRQTVQKHRQSSRSFSAAPPALLSRLAQSTATWLWCGHAPGRTRHGWLQCSKTLMQPPWRWNCRFWRPALQSWQRARRFRQQEVLSVTTSHMHASAAMRDVASC